MGSAVSVLHSGLNSMCSSPGQGHCVVSMHKMLFSHSAHASRHPAVDIVTGLETLGVTL